MRIAEAFEWAADFADRSKIFEPVRNERGYADGWKPPTPTEKLSVITKLALSVADHEQMDPLLDGESIIAFVTSVFQQHTNGSSPSSGNSVRYHVHENFLVEIRDHFSGR